MNSASLLRSSRWWCLTSSIFAGRARIGNALWIAMLVSAATLAFITPNPGYSAESLLAFDSDEQAALYGKLLKDHRCVKCQNQNLADSNAGIAADMRDEIYRMVRDGANEDAISGHLVARYGDFVLYRPPLKASTIALWFGPFLLLLVALFFAIKVGKRPEVGSVEPAQHDLQRAKELLDD